MSIIWCGGEEIDFPNGGSVEPYLATPYYDPVYSRCGIHPLATFGTIKSILFTGITSGWIHCYITMGSLTYTIPGMIGICQSSNSKGLWVGIPDSSKKFAIRTGDDASYNTLASESGTSLEGGDRLDLYFSGLGVSENVKLYHNGTLIIDFTGDVSQSSMSLLDCVYLRGGHSMFGNMTHFSQIIVADEDTRLMSLKTLVPNAAGDLNEWSGLYTDVDEGYLSDADTIYTTEGSKSVQLNLTGMPTGNFNVKAVKVIGRAADGTGVLDIKAGVKTNSVVHLGDQKGLEGAWKSVEEMFNTNPETANPFTSGEIDALQIAFQSVSTTTSTTT